jgi:hypothetical protein
VGQQVLYRLRILTREDVSSVEWIEPPTFAGVRAERLPGRPNSGDVVRDGVSYRVREEHRALFGEAPGRVELAPAGLRCRLAAGGEFRAAVPPVVLAVEALPPEGSPPGFSGLVGPLLLHTQVEPRSLRLGESVRLAVMLQGAGNLWDAPDPLAGREIPAAEIFSRRPTLRLEPGVRLVTRRHFAYDIVPREPGDLQVPAIRFDYFDPATGRYTEAASAPVTVPVGPRTSVPDPTPAMPSANTGDPAARGRSGALWIGIAAIVTAGLGVGALALRFRRSRSQTSDPAPLLAEARAARARGDAAGEAAALSRALREALAARIPAARTLSPDELLARDALTAAQARGAELLARVDRGRFDPRADPMDAVDADEVARAVANLED